MSLYFLLTTTLLLLTSPATATTYRPVSSKTVYDAFRGDVSNVTFECSTDRIFMLLRHGSRYFGTTAVPRMLKFLVDLEEAVKSGQVTLGPDMDWYRTWSTGSYPPNYDLVAEGMYEHYTIGKRFSETLPHLFPQPYSPEYYHVQTTTKSRTVQSGLSFLYGVLNGTGPLGPGSTARDSLSLNGGYLPPALNMSQSENDHLLRFMDSCPKYKSYIKSQEWKGEARLFETSQDVSNVVAAVSERIGMTLDLNATKAVYYLCAYEMMSPSNANGSHFCNLFTDDNLETMDFMKDLEKYYKYSYPFETGYKMSCLLGEALASAMEEEGETSPVLKFAHEETLVPLLTLLQLYEDQTKLTHETADYRERLFKMSHVAPFAGNLALVRMRCENGDTRIKMLVNERVVLPPGCDPAGCTTANLRSILSSRTGGCDYTSICSEGGIWDQVDGLRVALALLITLTLIQSTYIFFHCVKKCPGRRIRRDGEGTYSLSGGEPLLDDD